MATLESRLQHLKARVISARILVSTTKLHARRRASVIVTILRLAATVPAEVRPPFELAILCCCTNMCYLSNCTHSGSVSPPPVLAHSTKHRQRLESGGPWLAPGRPQGPRRQASSGTAFGFLLFQLLKRGIPLFVGIWRRWTGACWMRR